MNTIKDSNNRINTILAGIIIMIIFLAIGIAFNNPYPCTMSCVGCSSWEQMIADTWSGFIAFTGMLIGFTIVIRGIF